MRAKFIATTVVLLTVGTVGTTASQQGSRLPRDVATALDPLKTLTAVQTQAVAALVLADRAGFDVADYCPPIRQFAAPERFRCEGAIVSYASAVKECKKANPTWKDCPKVLAADAAWATCEAAHLADFKRQLDLLGRGGKMPGPQPRPVRPPGK